MGTNGFRLNQINRSNPVTSPNHNPDSHIVSVRERLATFGKPLRVDDLADILGVSAITIFKHAKDGRIPCYRIGSCVRFCPSVVAEWLKRQ